MQPTRRRRPPSLGGLAAFEAAAKHLSFTAAACELSVTQGAVSQQIRLLEHALGAQLFPRSRNAVALTRAGADLFVRRSGRPVRYDQRRRGLFGRC